MSIRNQTGRSNAIDHALGEFQSGYELVQNHFESLNDDQRQKTAHWATAAAWHQRDFQAMADYVNFHPRGTSKSSYKAILDINTGNYSSACAHIAKAQTISYDELQTHLGIGPQLSIKSLAKTEVLAELEEVIQYKTQGDSREQILRFWSQRFRRSHANANTWLKRLQVWMLACPPTTVELQSCFLDCAKLCESSGMHATAKRLINLVMPKVNPPVSKRDDEKKYHS